MDMETYTVQELTSRPVLPNNTADSLSILLPRVSTVPTLPNATSQDYPGRPRKGRKRKYGDLTREERKKRKYMNLPYVNSRKQTVEPKPFIDYKCTCTKKCHELIPVEKRQIEFNKFYSLGNYNAQNMFLAACVRESPVKRSYVKDKADESRKKTFSRQYLLQGTPVCRDMFVKTLQTTPKRVNTSLCKMRSDESPIDKRGKQGGLNKVSPERILFLINIIKSIPMCEFNGSKYLMPDMTFRKIFKLYCEEAAMVGMQPVSFSKAKQVFMTNFNLRTMPQKKDVSHTHNKT